MEKIKYYQEVGGIRTFTFFSEESVLSGMNYKAKPGDLFFVSYPKCGTTWMHYIVNLIHGKGQILEDPLNFVLDCPYLEIVGGEYIEMAKPLAIKTHLPFSAIPFSPEAKYIYTTRNPRDCCVSYYHFMKLLPFPQKELSFQEFFEAFLHGNLGGGDYFDHLLGWYEHKNDSNVHFVTYEDLKKDIKGEVLKIAKFMGEEYEKSILNDPTILENIIYYSSFDYMKESSKKNVDVFFDIDKTWLESQNLPPGIMKVVQNLNKKKNNTENGTLVRKGIVGDWENHFNEEQIRLLNEKIMERTKDSDVMNLWKDIFENN
ncbi:sulfotransferase 1C3-like [Centruroides sculpturatus]|uniref:sulfotransferase 1C3-like n=1 Tax=Centruroides sculpturatus TaxID=218467 RepID=UPI000C6DC721|nr:sulfotransferase 1C3-like [Centruroides sculpturatus]XP_023231869.1 sulfotransferase 1C3-like [Centruroides sculpturatus]XP_023231870.1 sulfotransferase 1C3-like [Centruroides sculpturatus]